MNRKIKKKKKNRNSGIYKYIYNMNSI
jgi:hypothetical protein